MLVILNAVHSRIRPLVLSESALRKIESVGDLRDATGELWKSGWQPDPDVEVILTGWGTPPLDEHALDLFPKVRSIIHTGGSIRSLITSDPWSRGITVVTSADANNEYVADFVAAQAYLTLNGSHRSSVLMRSTGVRPGFQEARGTRSSTVGLVSYGSIARKVRDRLRRYGTHVLAWDPYVSDEEMRADDVVPCAELGELFRSADLVSLHAPLIEGVTTGLVSAELLSSLPPGAILINTARGALIDEHALIDTLTARPDIYAVLDVTAPEPPPSDSQLYDLPNVTLTGHTAGAVGSECQALGDLAVRELTRLSEGQSMLHAVAKAQAMLRA